MENFSNFVVADNIDKLINYNIENKKISSNRYCRGNIGEISGDVAEFYLNNSSTPIPNVKIADNTTVFENDDAYALAINGSLNNLVINSNVHNFEAIFGCSFNNFMIIEGFQDSTEWYALATTPLFSDDYIYKKYRKQGVRFTWCQDVTDMYFLQKIISPTLDLTSYPNGDLTNTDNDYFGIAWYVSDIDAYHTSTYINLYFDNGGGNYFSCTIDSSSHTIVEGWNFAEFQKNNAGEMGSPNWNNINYITIEFSMETGYIGEFITCAVICLYNKYSPSSGSLPQPLDTTDSPTFANLTLSGLTTDRVIYVNGSGQLTSSLVTSTAINYLQSQNQYLRTNSDVVFNDIEALSIATNSPAKIFISQEASSIANNNRAELICTGHPTSGNPLAMFRFYDQTTEKSQFNILRDGSFEWKINSNKALEINYYRNILTNGATTETSAYGCLTMKQGTNPSTSSADQISIFATSGTDCTLGLRTEVSVVSATPVIDSYLPININGTLYNLPLQVA